MSLIQPWSKPAVTADSKPTVQMFPFQWSSRESRLPFHGSGHGCSEQVVPGPQECRKRALEQVCLTLRPVPVAYPHPLHCGPSGKFSLLFLKQPKARGRQPRLWLSFWLPPKPEQRALSERRKTTRCLVFGSILAIHAWSASLGREEDQVCPTLRSHPYPGESKSPKQTLACLLRA